MGNYQPKNMSNNFERVRDMQNVSMNHEVAPADCVIKNYVKRPLAED